MPGISDAIRAKLKDHPAQRGEILRIAGAPRGTSIDGAETPMRAATPGKVLPSRKGALPHEQPMPSVAAARPVANWPQNPAKLSSGLARPTAHPTLPSKFGPSR
jgi:hypothetical protein